MQQETKLISQGASKAEVVLISIAPNGTRTSTTKHYRVVKGQFTDKATVVGGRHLQKEDGKYKPWLDRGKRR